MRFLAFEGLDGSGKSTLMAGLRAALDDRGLSYVQTREPGGTPLGDHIRNLLLSDDGEPPCPRAEALLYQAARAQHVDRLILPTLKRGTWVLSDRFAASSLAFQAGGRAITREHIEWLNTFATNQVEPDLYVFLDLTVTESQARVGRRAQADRFEREAEEFHERVRTEYQRLARANPERWLTLSAAQPPAALVAALLKDLAERAWLD